MQILCAKITGDAAIISPNLHIKVKEEAGVGGGSADLLGLGMDNGPAAQTNGNYH